MSGILHRALYKPAPGLLQDRNRAGDLCWPVVKTWPRLAATFALPLPEPPGDYAATTQEMLDAWEAAATNQEAANMGWTIRRG